MFLLLTGCAAVGPDYVRPPVSAPEKWNSDTKVFPAAKETVAGKMGDWWAKLNDPVLTDLMERAVRGNMDVRKATARIREARARRGVAEAGLLPALDASGGVTRSRVSGGGGPSSTSSLFSSQFDAAWELDIFGGIRRSVEAAGADLEASREGLNDVLVSMLAEVAINYIDMRTFQDRLAVAEANLATQEETYQLTSWRSQAGLSDDLAVRQAHYNLESTRSTIPALRAGMKRAMHNIDTLLGEQPGKVSAGLEKPATLPSVPADVSIGLPAEMLNRRPDVRRAERELAAQTARVGEATAELYPKFSLSGLVKLEALSWTALFHEATKTFSGGPSAAWPLFRGGAIRNNIEAQTALRDQAQIQYETTILNALSEVESALVAYAEERERTSVLRDGVDSARNAAELARQKYEAGLTDFNNVLDAQRTHLSFQDQLAQSNGAVLSNLVRLYKALGGGWESLVAVQ